MLIHDIYSVQSRKIIQSDTCVIQVEDFYLITDRHEIHDVIQLVVRLEVERPLHIRYAWAPCYLKHERTKSIIRTFVPESITTRIRIKSLSLSLSLSLSFSHNRLDIWKILVMSKYSKDLFSIVLSDRSSRSYHPSADDLLTDSQLYNARTIHVQNRVSFFQRSCFLNTR